MKRFCRDVFCVVVLRRFKTNSLIKNLANCEILAVIRFLNAKNLTAAEINRKLCGVWEPNAKSERKCGIELGNSKVADQKWTMKIAVTARPSWMATFLKKSTTQFVKIGSSQFQSPRVFHKFHYITSWNCGREAALPHSLCKMDAQIANGWTSIHSERERTRTNMPVKREWKSN
jgi:hypothetical protein